MIIKFIILILLYYSIKILPFYKNYSQSVRFNIYRSIMCLFFSGNGLNILFNNFFEGISNPFGYNNDEISELIEWFICYLSFDLLKMIFDKNKRIDLYIHHLICLTVYYFVNNSNKKGFIFGILLINESISIVSGFDKLAIEDNNLKESYYYKIYRKYVIKLIRLPIWIGSLVAIVSRKKEIPKYVYYLFILILCLMIYLDRYWEKLCDKVINKHKNK